MCKNRVFVILRLAFSISFLFAMEHLHAQSLTVGSVLDDYYRRTQLLGKIDYNLSFAIRPLSMEALRVNDVFDPDSSLQKNHEGIGPLNFGKGRGLFQILPLTWRQQVNSDHPYGWNDGAIIPARGYQTMISGGVYFKYSFFSMQLRPEYVYAVNTNFNGFASGHSQQEIQSYYAFHNMVDAPEQFGTGVYRKFLWGQSNVSLNFGPMNFGLSSENLWWGPGIQNALVLTNNAAGFAHLTLNTTSPIKTPIGRFEAQVIAGHLNNSSYPPILSDVPNNVNKNNDWRYLSAFNINYQPNFIPGFTLGFIRSFDSYYSDVKKAGFSAYIPFFIPFQKNKVNNGVGDEFPRDQITTLYTRWMFKKALAEIYFEYGWEDNLYNLADFEQTPEHSRAYIAGFRKLLPINGDKQYLSVNIEATQTSQHAESFVREIGLWYLNYQLQQGHTNAGQVLGAGTGSGGNIQSFDVSWFAGLKSLGFSVDRYEHDADFANGNMPPINNNSRNWVDLALGLHGQLNYKNFLFNIKLQEIQSLNYEWILKDYTPDQYYIPHNTIYNFHGELGITYRF